MTPQEILFNVTGQYLVLDCEDGRPSSVTSVEVRAITADDTQDSESATTGSAAVETDPNTTLSAAAGPAQPDPTALTLTAGTGVSIGRVFRLTEDGTGVYEDTEVKSVNGTAVTLRHPLLNDYSSGSLYVSCRASIAVSSTWVAELSNISPLWNPYPYWRVRWVVVVGGVTRVYMRHFDLLRYPASINVTAIEMDRQYPGWLDRLPPDYQADQGRALIRRAWEDVRAEFRGDGKNLASLRDEDIRAHLIMRRAFLNLQRDQIGRSGGNLEALELADRDWRQAYDQHIRSPVAPVDTTGGGAAHTQTFTQLWRRI